MTPIRIVIVDDHRVVSQSLKTYLESFADMQVVGIAPNGEALLEHLREWVPGVVIQDLLMPGGIDGIEAIRRVKRVAPRTKVIALTASTDEARMIGALRVGAEGYVRKDAEPETLLAAIRAVAGGATYLDPAVSRAVLAAATPADDLTDREFDVLRQLVLGRSNKDIAAALALAEETVKTHVGSLLAKLRAENRSQAVVLALKRGLVTLDD